MPNRLAQAPLSVWEQGKAIMDKWHSELGVADVKIEYIFAFAPEPDDDRPKAPALKLHGYPCSGIAGIVNLEGRVMGRQDGKIVLDGDQWGNMTEAQQNALLDHELSHFNVARTVEGEIIYDTSGRPKLKMRLHDYQFGFFTDIAERHGVDSMEVKQAEIFFRESGQIYFPFTAAPELDRRRPLKGLKKIA